MYITKADVSLPWDLLQVAKISLREHQTLFFSFYVRKPEVKDHCLVNCWLSSTEIVEYVTEESFPDMTLQANPGAIDGSMRFENEATKASGNR